MRSRRLKRLWVFFSVLMLAFIFCEAALWDGLAVRTYIEATGKVSAPVRLGVITDLHDTLYGENQSELIAAIEKLKPDALLFVGDITYSDTPGSAAAKLFDAVCGEYPCFYVSGNHEYWAGQAEAIKTVLRTFGVTVFEGTGETVKINGQTIYLAGVDDPVMSAPPGCWEDGSYGDWLTQLEQCKNNDKDIYSVLLSHRPELVRFFEGSGFDLVVSGHAHGGQVRIPFIINGLYAPNQGQFPKYTGGLYNLDGVDLIVSRGLCIDNLPRVFNRPEIVMVLIVPEAD